MKRLIFEIYIIWWSPDSGHIKLYMICINLYQYINVTGYLQIVVMLCIFSLRGVMNVLVGKETQVNSAIAELCLVFLLHFNNCTYIYIFSHR